MSSVFGDATEATGFGGEYTCRYRGNSKPGSESSRAVLTPCLGNDRPLVSGLSMGLSPTVLSDLPSSRLRVFSRHGPRIGLWAATLTFGSAA
jgi:hypothetical protein